MCLQIAIVPVERIMIRRMLAGCAVADTGPAEEWYTRLFDRSPDARPMSGLIEWHLDDTFGVQVWLEPDRAGHSSVVFDETDLDGAAARLTAVGIERRGPQPGGGARILPLTDPDGNRVVLIGN